MIKARLKQISQSYTTGLWEITFEMIEGSPAILEAFKDAILNLTIKKWHKHRSLDANAYYWQLVEKLAEAEKISKPFLHNMLLRQYGQLEYVGNQLIEIWIPDTDEGQTNADEAMTFHVRPTTNVKTDYRNSEICTLRQYHLLRGSHTYDSKEMAELIDGLVEKCREAGIETMTPDDLRRMCDKWRPKAYCKR